MQQQTPEFKPTSWAIRNRVSVFILTGIISLLGLYSYNILPKEQFPEIVIPTIYVGTVYPGTSPTDIENGITRPIEKRVKSLTGVKKVVSQSIQDFSAITIEFQLDIDPAIAKQRVRDAVDKAKSELPSDLPADPTIQEVDFSEFPIMAINLSGDFTLPQLKEYAEDIQDRVEQLKEITRVDIIGAPERELQINVDVYRMNALGVSFNDIRSAVANENLNIAGGELKVDGMERTLRLQGEFTSAEEISNIVVAASGGSKVFLKDIATVVDGYAERKSFARLDRKPVITMSVIKRSGENLISAADEIKIILDEMKASKLPPSLNITITNDQSESTRTSLNDLNNSVVIGFILVTVVLMFFMGLQNALFVALAIPISAALAFTMMPGMDYTFNIVVTFTFLLALGIIVDNAIVVVENTYRLHHVENMSIMEAAKYGAGEVFTPVLAGTLTTIAPFFPLLFWPGIVGKFMMYLPVVLIITLTASLFVAFIINPTFAVKFMDKARGASRYGWIIATVILALLAVGSYLSNSMLMGNLFLFFIILGLSNKFFITPVLIRSFQEWFIPRMTVFYTRTLEFVLEGSRPYIIIVGTGLLFVVTIMLLSVFAPKVIFFPESEPNFTYIYLKLPVGTEARYTDSVTAIIEDRVFEILKDDMPAVKSIISNVGLGAGDPSNPDRSITPHKGKVTVAYVKFDERKGVSTSALLNKIRNSIQNIPGAEISVEKESNGPPVGKPINIEISGDNLDSLMAIEMRLKKLIVDTLRIPGIDNLKSDLTRNKPEVIVALDRLRAQQEGISTGQIGSALRAALYGDSVSKFRDGEDEYAIRVRLQEEYRQDVNALMNMNLSFREQATGQFRQIPISSFADVYYSNTFGGINRKNLKRVITLSSNVLPGYNANEINEAIRSSLTSFDLSSGYEVNLTGEQEDQKETQDFLGFAFILSIILIFYTMATQFNSIIKPGIIMVTILFSTIGVFLGYMAFQITISIVMTGVGIVSLAGIVVNNGIVLLDFTQILQDKGYSLKRAIIEAGTVRLAPVLLTAITTVLGLVPLAVGLNIDFVSLFAEFDPKIFFGGDSAAFWSALAWAIIFGLTFSTFLTLIVVPAMYLVTSKIQLSLSFRASRKAAARKKILDI